MLNPPIHAKKVDLFLELVEVVLQLTDTIDHELEYYRASVYKQESLEKISVRLSELRLTARLIEPCGFEELFADHEAAAAPVDGNLRSHECAYTLRVRQLLAGVRAKLQERARHAAFGGDGSQDLESLLSSGQLQNVGDQLRLACGLSSRALRVLNSWGLDRRGLEKN